LKQDTLLPQPSSQLLLLEPRMAFALTERGKSVF
jgi:hypothetical protein